MASGMRAQTQPPWISTYKIALDHIRGGKSEVGVRELEALGASFPRDVVLATSIGAALDSDSLHQQAARWYEKALAIDPQYEPALNNLALNLTSRGQLQNAVPLFQRALKINPQNGRAAYNLALITLRLKRYREALNAFQAARKVPEPAAPSETIALGEGTALFKLGRYAEAANVLNSSSTCSEAPSCLLLGSSQALSSDLPAAVSTFQTAVRLAPNNPDGYFRLALAFLQGKRDDEAKETLAVGLEAVPNSALLLYGQAIFYEHLGRYEEAVGSAMRSIEEDPARADVWSLLGSLHAHQAQREEAEKAFQRALQLDAGVDAAAEYSEFLINEGRYQEAEKTLDALRPSHASDAAINRGLGKLYKAQGKFDKAAVFLRRAVSEDPQDPTAHYALAITLQRLHRDAEAKKELELFSAAKEERRFVRVLQISSDRAATNSGEK
jgi:tetratricopeptide (TPR) repeat protein